MLQIPWQMRGSNSKMLQNAVEMAVSSSKMLQIARETDRTGDPQKIIPKTIPDPFIMYSCSTPLLWCVDVWVATLWLKDPVLLDEEEVYSERHCIVISRPLHCEEKLNTYGIKLHWHLYIAYVWFGYVWMFLSFCFILPVTLPLEPRCHAYAMHHRWGRERSGDWNSANQVRREHHLHLLMGEASTDFRNWTKQEIICIHWWHFASQCQDLWLNASLVI